MAVSGERLESYVTCHSSYATHADITVGDTNSHAHMFADGRFRSHMYNVTEKDHMAEVKCSVSNDHFTSVLETTKKIFVAGTLICVF